MSATEQSFHHTLTIDEALCQGCTHCMKRCPTQAIRITGGKAHVDSERCIDCGQCMAVCPHHAIILQQSDLEHIYAYTHRVAIVPAMLFGQFDDSVACADILDAIGRLGFTSIQIAEFGIDILKALGGRISVYADDKPVISSYCPAVVRLIQISFPSLLRNINLMRTPAQITALFTRLELVESGIPSNEIGIFYVTPCAAKYAQIKSPQSDSLGIIQGGINLDSLYNLIKAQLTKHKDQRHEHDDYRKLGPITRTSFKWVLSKGESSAMPGRTLAVDEIHNVIKFLELVEENNQDNLDFLELRACDTGCTGGILATRNRFLATERLNHIAEALPEVLDEAVVHRIQRQGERLIRNLKNQRLEAKHSLKLDRDVETAIRKMERAHIILQALPGIDCGLCGSPTCAALAEDIVRLRASIRQCMVLKLKNPEGLNALARIWGGKASQGQPD